jgi:hypothetical protein
MSYYGLLISISILLSSFSLAQVRIGRQSEVPPSPEEDIIQRIERSERPLKERIFDHYSGSSAAVSESTKRELNKLSRDFLNLLQTNIKESHGLGLKFTSLTEAYNFLVLVKATRENCVCEQPVCILRGAAEESLEKLINHKQFVSYLIQQEELKGPDALNIQRYFYSLLKKD